MSCKMPYKIERYGFYGNWAANGWWGSETWKLGMKPVDECQTYETN